MLQNDLNNSFKKRLEGYSSDIDHNVLWGDIVNRVPQKKKKRRLLFWWFAMTGIGMVILGIVYSTSLITGQANGKQLANSSAIKEDAINKLSTTMSLNEPAILNSDIKPIASTGTLEERNHGSQKSNINEIINNGETLQNQHPASKSITTKSKVQEKFENTLLHSPLFQRERTVISDQTSRIQLNSVSKLQFLDFDLLSVPIRDLPRIRKKRPKRISPRKDYKTNFFHINYAIGPLNISSNLDNKEPAYINDGTAHSSQSMRLQYGRFLSKRFYAKAIANIDISTKKFTASVSRDTVVPSSIGEQLLATNIYINGVIDTKSGVPEVQATINRSVQKLNRFQAINLGLGVGYIQKIGNLSFHIESSLTRSFSFNLNGLGIEGGAQRIKSLSSISDYYSTAAIYNGQIDLGLEIPLTKSLSISVGTQYQHGLNNRLILSESPNEKHHSLRGTMGMRKYW